MFGIGLREAVIVAFVLVLLFGLPFWVRAGKRLLGLIRDRFRLG
jgi:Sec-independent protein translocase protein TatA